jgi:WD40 repeat protein
MRSHQNPSRSSTSLLRWLSLSLSCCVPATLAQAEDLPAKVTFDEHIKPIMREHCTSCHNANDKKSGLALDNYASTMAGGSGGESLVAGDPESSRLWALTSHYEQPKMPPNQDKISDAKLALLKRWIQQGMPENNGSEIMAPKVDLSAMGAVSQARPEGAPPMPKSTLKQTPLFTERAAATSALAASPWSPLVAVGGQEQVVLYHSQTGDLLGVLPFPEGEPQSITFSRDGRLILVGGGRHAHSGFAVLYEIETGKRVTRVGDELDIVMAADLSEDNTKIALGGPQKMLRIYETATGKLLHDIKKHTDWIYAVRFSPDGLLVASADRSNGLFVWEAESGRLFLDLIGHKAEIRSVAWRPDSLAMVSSSLDGTLKLWDMQEGKLIKSWDAHGGGVLAVATNNEGTIASTGKDKRVRLWKSNGDALVDMPNLAEAGMEVAVTVDSKNVVAGDWLGNVRLWDKADPKKEVVLRANPFPLQQAIQEAEKGLPQLILANAADEKVLKEVEAKVAAAKQELTSAEKAVGDLKTKIDAKQAEANVAIKESAEREAGLKAALSKVEESRKKLQEKANQMAVLSSQEKDTSANQKEIDAIQKSIDEQDQSISTLRKSHVVKNSALAVIQTQIAGLTAAKPNAEKAIEPKKAAYEAVSKTLAEAKSKSDASKARVAMHQKRIESLRNDLVAFDNTKKQWTTRNEELQKQLVQIDQQREAAQSALQAEESSQAAILAKVDAIAKQMEQLQKSVAQLESQKSKAEQSIAEKQTAIETLGAQLGQLKAEQQVIADQLQAYAK